MNFKLGLTLVIGGAVFAVLSIFADTIGVGTNPDVFGRRQLIGTVVGSASFIIGILVMIIERREDKLSQLPPRPKEVLSRLPGPSGTPPHRLLNSPSGSMGVRQISHRPEDMS